MDKAEAMRLIQAALDEFGKINVPKLQQLILQKQKDTQLAGIKDDPQYRADQEAASSQLNDVINSGGLTLADRAALNSIQQKLARNAGAANEATAQQMASRGTLDSGAQLGMALAQNQNTAQNAAQAGEATSAQAQSRLFAAIQERARQAGQGLDRTYSQKANAARAQDAINAGNTSIANLAARYNASIPQQDFENQMALAKAKADPTYKLSGAHAAQAKDTQDTWSGLGKAAGAAGSKASGSGNTGFSYDEGAALNTPSADTAFGSSPNDWNAYPGDSSSGALTGTSTRPPETGGAPPPGYILEGYTADGKPRYIKDPNNIGQNF